MIGDRNNLAVALVMILPLILYLAKENGKYIYARWALYGVAGLTTLAVLGTYSRGGAIALLAVVALLAIRARRFVYGVAVAGLVVAGLIVATPPELVNRLSTIESAAEEDRSFQTRLISWYVYFQAGLDRPLTGVGPGAAQVYDVYFRYVPPESLFGFLPDRGFTAHSLYFELWGEYGVLGFLIYNGLILQMLWSLRRTRQLARTLADDHWAGELANALFIGIVGFCVGAAALSLAFYDGFLLMLALAAGLREVVEQERRDAGRVAPPARPGRGRARAPA
jgi:probable O-glycosylation ligase (exosortase A-associated)